MAGRFALFIAMAGLLMYSCSDPEVTPRVDGQDYFPLNDTTERVYEVEEIMISPLGGSDTTNYQLMERVGDKAVTEAGDTVYVLYRYTRIDDGAEWDFQNTRPVRVQKGNLLVTENNIPYARLSFPFFEGKNWDGNAYNAFDEDEYTMQNVGESYTLKGNTYSETVTVVQEDVQDTIVQKDIRMEIYARNTGLIYKESVLLNYCTRPECLGEGIIEDGRLLKQILIGE